MAWYLVKHRNNFIFMNWWQKWQSPPHGHYFISKVADRKGNSTLKCTPTFTNEALKNESRPHNHHMCHCLSPEEPTHGGANITTSMEESKPME